MDNDQTIKQYSDYFHLDARNRVTKCMVTDCRTTLTGWYISNLKIHLETAHSSIYCEMQQSNGNGIDQGAGGRESKRPNAVNVKTNAAIVREGVLEMATLNGSPFSVFNSSGFRKVCQPLFKALQMSIHSENIDGMIAARAYAIIERIKCLTKHQAISVMLDIVKKFDRCILGTAIQFYDRDTEKLKCFTISMYRLDRRQTAQNICDILCTTLQKFEIHPLQIISLTTDNARNMVNVTDHINTIAIAADDCFILEKDNGAGNNYEAEQDDESDIILFDEEYLEDLVASAAHAYRTNQPTTNYVNRVNCGIHTLQLAIKDVLKMPLVAAQIDLFRDISKKLRTPILSAELGRFGVQKALMDVPTRWNSTYDMVGLILYAFESNLFVLIKFKVKLIAFLYFIFASALENLHIKTKYH